jgi:AcrR family transcriptional regulator
LPLTPDPPAPAAPRTVRADARRNREKLLAAAVDAFAERGTDVSLESIAADAGVGIGTLYRHFPTRDALVEAAYRNEVEILGAAAEELLAAGPADDALAEWMDRFVEYAAAKRGMGAALQSLASNSELYAEGRAQIIRAIGALLAAGTADGTIRRDVEPEDVMRAMGGIWVIPDDPDWADRAHRLLRLLMDGLRYGA